ncbi:MAG: hypothetical protein WD294_04420 [Phycisphaeraceae bacterium]
MPDLLGQWMYQPALPPMQVLAIVALLLGLTVFAYFRSAGDRPAAAAGFGGMRVLAVLLLGALLMGPSVIPEADEEQTARATLTVMLDTSTSMLTPPTPPTSSRSAPPTLSRSDSSTDSSSGTTEGATRFEHLTEHWLNAQQLAGLDEHFDVRLLGFDTAGRPLSADQLAQPAAEVAVGSGTRYAESLTTALLDLDRATRGEPAELLLLGDGHDTTDASLNAAAAFAAERGIAVHTVAVGSQRQPPNVAVVALPRQEYLLIEEQGQLIVQVHQGGLNDATVQLYVESDGERIERTIDFAGRRSVTVDIPIEHEQPGVYAYDVHVEPLPGEVATADNQQRAFVEVLDRSMRVLILEGEPYWDTKFLAQSLRRDARLELTQITQVSTQRQEGIVTRTGAEATVPTSVEAFAAYDVVILGRQVEAVLDAEGLAALRDWVLDEGGQLVLARGRPYALTSNAGRTAGEILSMVEPVRWHEGLVRNVPLSLTPAGRSSPLFSMAGLNADLDDAFATLPPMRVIYAVDSLKPAALVLARLGPGQRVGRGDDESASAPAIVEMNVGSGRVLALLGEGLWKWRLLAPNLAEYDGIFDAFWSNAVRYLAAGSEFQPGENVTLQLGRSIVQAGDPLTVDVVLRHAPPPGFDPTVTLTAPDGQMQDVTPTLRPGARNRYRATVHPDAVGVWRASLEAAELQPTQQERPFSVYQLDLERLRSEARPQVLRDLSERTGGLFFDAAEPVNLAEQLERRRTSQRVPPSAEYIWDSGLILLLLVLWLGLEWVGRRRLGWL